MAMQDTLTIDGKIYISSRRAAEMSKYSNDYIGQLCRAGKVIARMMGRTWFVDQQSLINHKRTSEDAFRARGKKSVYTSEPREVFGIKDKTYEDVVPQSRVEEAPIPVKAIEPAKEEILASNSTLTYLTDDRPLIPELKKYTAPEIKIRVSRPSASPVADIVDGRAVSYHARPSSYVDVLDPSIRLKKMLAIFFALGVLTAGGWLSVRSGVWQSGGARSLAVSETASVASSAHDFIIALGTFIGNLISGSSKHLAVNEAPVESLPTSPVAAPVSSEGGPYSGMAVTPSTGSSAEDEAVKARIRSSFSDEVTVKPDPSGTAGVITPVFKDVKSNDYLYLLVPVKEQKTQ